MKLKKDKIIKRKSSYDRKSAAIKCISLIVSSGLLIYSFSSCLNKISAANNTITGTLNGTVTANGSPFDSDAFFADTSTDDNSGTTTFDDISSNGSVSTDNSDNSASPGADKSISSQSTSTAKKDNGPHKPSSKEEIVAYFNTVINKVKPDAKAITQTNETSYPAGNVDLGSLGVFESTVDKLISANMGEKEERCGLTVTSVADKNRIFPVENEEWSSKLTAADVKEAKCVEKDGIYTIGLRLVDDDLNPSADHGEGHCGKAMSIVRPQAVRDNAGAASSLLDGLKIGYENSTIIIKVDAETGNVVSAAYDYTWILHVDSFGGINIPFGITQMYEIKW